MTVRARARVCVRMCARAPVGVGRPALAPALFRSARCSEARSPGPHYLVLLRQRCRLLRPGRGPLRPPRCPGEDDDDDDHHQGPRRAAMKLSGYLERRLEEVCPPKGARLSRRAFNVLQGTRVSVVVSGAVALLAIVDCFTKESYLAASLGIRFLTGILSCIVAQGVYVYRREGMRRVLGDMAAVAQRLEANADDDAQASMARAARRCARLQRLYGAYSVMVVASVLFPTLSSGSLSMPVWPRPEHTPEPRVAAAAALASQVITGTCCPIAFYTLVGLMVVTQQACGALYRAAGAEVQAVRAPEALLDCARLHGRLSAAAALLDRLTSDVMVLLLSAVLLLPIQGMYDIVQGHIDAYLLSSFPIILVVFVPICISGQGLSDASELVGLRAYQGRWPAEAPEHRRVRAFVMLRASRPACITCRGLGALGLPVCESVLKSWFSYLQMLLNLSNKTAHATD
ncbi:uncharacterized protein LOC113213466 isoform X2 [Frankliniella occidentalis]|uniref:Uncharacterized protein LOC113213466 isoform X2 n=1 Tax=Frankliniella occidentalis TaxID=133901 RepID=A0A9C6XTL9_FRAOC|nr:uncharacterized protein LOC113213466 isoform X2 [Frankliniella occidentalis]